MKNLLTLSIILCCFGAAAQNWYTVPEKTETRWVNFYRQDDECSTAYFYLDSPTSTLPALQPVAQRVAGLPEKFRIWILQMPSSFFKSCPETTIASGLKRTRINGFR